MKTLFRTDSSSSIGVGHIMRDLVLAKRLGGDISFACLDLEGNIMSRIPYPLHRLREGSAQELIDLIRSEGYERVVFDHYGIDEHFEKQVKEESGAEIIALDDTYERHHCDILLNHNLYADPAKYATLVPDHCTLWCGGEHTLIREEFALEKKINREKIYDLLIIMGGADVTNQIGTILSTITEDTRVAVLTTTANAHLDTLRAHVSIYPNIELFVNTDNVARIMNQSKRAILTPSTVVHEAIFMELPFIAIQSASNQDDMVKYLKSEGYEVKESIG